MDNNTNEQEMEIFDTIYSASELQLFYKEIDKIISSLFIGGSSIEDKMAAVISPEKKERVMSFLKATDANLSNPVEIQEALLKLKKMGETLPVVYLELAFEPTEQILKNISLWFLRRMNKKVILDTTLERQDIGGAYITFGGLYKDYTLKTKIDKYFEKGAQPAQA